MTPRRAEGQKQSFVFWGSEGAISPGTGGLWSDGERCEGLRGSARAQGGSWWKAPRTLVCDGGPGRAACSCLWIFWFISVFSSSSEY